MTFDEAMKAARKGFRVSCDDTFGIGWTVGVYPGIKGTLFAFNPRTGSNYEYHATAADKKSTNWRKWA